MTKDEQLTSPKYNLEVGDDVPNLELILSALDQAQSDAAKYFQRSADAFDLWHSCWDGQTLDGRKHGDEDNPAFPWENAADGRMRTCERIVNEELTVTEFAFDMAKIQAQSVREFANGREVNQATRLLRWQLASNMRANLQREVPLALAWFSGYGASMVEIGWEQSRRLDWFEISIPDIDQIMQARGGDPQMQWLMQAIFDPEQEDALTTLMQQLSPIISRPDARKIVKDLREIGKAKVPVANVLQSRPRWTALRLMVDVIFPAELDDPQSPDARWIDRIYPITETEAYDRITTDGWDEEFVKEVCKHKGEFSNARWMRRTDWERSRYRGAGYGIGGGDVPPGENSLRDLIEIHEFRIRGHAYDTPCLYKTVFSPHVIRREKGPDKPLYAKHGPDEYDHGKFPFIALRREQLERSLLSSRGIPEIAYTWEQEEKVQADGMTDLTSLQLQPPMIVPKNRERAMRGQRMPGAVLGVVRPSEIQWMTPPQFNNLPVQVQERIDVRIEKYFGLFGDKVDPDLKQLRRQRLGKKILNQFSLGVQMTLELDQQYLPDPEIADIVGTLQRPFHLSREQIEGAHQITATIDMGMLDEDAKEKKLALIGQAMQYNQGGSANVNRLFQIAMEAIDPDLADAVVEDQQTSTDREKKEETSAINSIMSGIDQPFPQFGNFQLRLQTLLEATFQSKNPQMPNRLSANQDSVQMLQNRIKYFENQIQQHTQNPQIGRALATQTFDTRMAPQLTNGAGGE